jgi:hypothetical protein
MNEVRTNEYTVLKLEDSGQYGWRVISGWQGQDGVWKPNFVKREFKKGSGEKVTPLSVDFGDKYHAITALKTFLEVLEGKSETPF